MEKHPVENLYGCKFFYLCRHKTSCWGTLCPHDRKAALASQIRLQIFSSMTSSGQLSNTQAPRVRALGSLSLHFSGQDLPTITQSVVSYSTWDGGEHTLQRDRSFWEKNQWPVRPAILVLLLQHRRLLAEQSAELIRGKVLLSGRRPSLASQLMDNFFAKPRRWMAEAFGELAGYSEFSCSLHPLYDKVCEKGEFAIKLHPVSTWPEHADHFRIFWDSAEVMLPAQLAHLEQLIEGGSNGDTAIPQIKGDSVAVELPVQNGKEAEGPVPLLESSVAPKNGHENEGDVVPAAISPSGEIVSTFSTVEPLGAGRGRQKTSWAPWVSAAAAAAAVLAALALGIELGKWKQPEPAAGGPNFSGPVTILDASSAPGDATCLCRITKPGPYRLSRDLKGAPGKHGIVIEADFVSLDLAGFRLLGGPDSLNGICGGLQPHKDIDIRNGFVVEWGRSGVDLGGFAHAQLSNLRVEGCMVHGYALGSNFRILSCLALGNKQDGFLGGSGGEFSDCSAMCNGLSGFSQQFHCLILRCKANTNGAAGFYLNSGCQLEHCFALGNRGTGMSIDSGSLVSHCTVSNSGHNGLEVQHSIVENCLITDSAHDGLWTGSGSVIRGNICRNNNAGGLNVDKDYNRVEDNHILENQRGLEVDGQKNFLARNFVGESIGVNIDITLPDKNLVAPIVPWEFGAPVNEQLAWANYEVLKPEERTRSNKD